MQVTPLSMLFTILESIYLSRNIPLKVYFQFTKVLKKLRLQAGVRGGRASLSSYLNS